MSTFRNILLLVFLITPLFHYAQYTDEINSNRPGKSISAFSIGKTVFQVEGGMFGIHEKHDLLYYEKNGFGVDLNLRYGAFLEQLEFCLDSQYQYDWHQEPLVYDTEGGFKQFTIGAKYLIYDPFFRKERKPNLFSWKMNHKFNWDQFIPAVGLYGGININMGSNPYEKTVNTANLANPIYPNYPAISPKIMLVTQNQFGSRWVFITNVIADKFFTDYKSIDFIATLTRGFNLYWSGMLEFQGYNGDYYSDTVWRVGAARLIGKNMQIDASLSKNFKNTPAILYGNLGFSWRIDNNYEMNYTRVKTQKEKEKEEKKKTDKNKSKTDKGKKQKTEAELENYKP